MDPKARLNLTSELNANRAWFILVGGIEAPMTALVQARLRAKTMTIVAGAAEDAPLPMRRIPIAAGTSPTIFENPLDNR
jgi:hypothetical protein